jgi:hypothetical protein
MSNFEYTGSESQKAFLRQLFLYESDAVSIKESVFSRKTLCKAANDIGFKYPPAWIVKDSNRLFCKGCYRVPEINNPEIRNFNAAVDGVVSAKNVVDSVAAVMTPPMKRKYTRKTSVTPSIPTTPAPVIELGTKFETNSTQSTARSAPSVTMCDIPIDDALRPIRPKWYVENKIHNLLFKIFSSRRFVPVFIYGHKGTGKTTAILAAAADCNREVYRVNITSETSEDDLLGGFRLINGDTVWSDGPVTLAMKRGAILVLDEMDRGDRKILCLQPVLEGNPVLLKKIGRVVVPQPGFTIVATGNTRGRGSEDNRYNGAYVQDEALLDRFHIGFHQDFPDKEIEYKILVNVGKHVNHHDNAFVKTLIAWANQIRKTFQETGDGEIISTRNLVDAVRLLPILCNEMEVIESICGKFDPITAKSFINLYAAVKECPKTATLGDEVTNIANSANSANSVQ